MGCYQSKTKEAYNPHTNVMLSNKKKRFSSKKDRCFSLLSCFRKKGK